MLSRSFLVWLRSPGPAGRRDRLSGVGDGTIEAGGWLEVGGWISTGEIAPGNRSGCSVDPFDVIKLSFVESDHVPSLSARG